MTSRGVGHPRGAAPGASAPGAVTPGALAGGALNALVALVSVLSLGLIASASLGGAVQLGVRAAFVAVIAGGAVYALLGSIASPAASPSSATAVIFAALVLELGRDPLLNLAKPADLLALVAVLASAVVAMGLLQAVFGLIGLGRLARFTPQPVLAGFMNAVALVIVIAQIRPLLGLPQGTSLVDPATLALAQPGALLVGALSAASVWWVGSRLGAKSGWRRVPAPLLGLIVGLALHAVLSRFVPGLGRTIGALPQGWVSPDALGPLIEGSARGLWQRHAAGVLLTVVVLALIGSLESLFSAMSLDETGHRPHDSRRELLALGAANVASGLCGGMPLSISRIRSNALLASGHVGRAPVVVAAIAFAAMYAVGGALLARLPTAVLAGVMVTIALALIDRWTRQLVRQWRAGERSPEARWSLVVIVLVCAVTLIWGFAAGVVAGVLLSVLIFMRSVQRSLLRDRHGADRQSSRRIYPRAHEDWLRQARRRIVVFELEGSLFFGSAARLMSECDTLPDDCRFLVLDFRRVTTLDESAAMALQQLSRHLGQRGVTMLMAAVTAENRHGKRLRAAGCFRDEPRADWWRDTDLAVESAEQALIAEAGMALPPSALPLVETALFRGLDAAQRERLLAAMRELRLRPGDVLFAEGDPGDETFVLSEGSISIVAGGAAQGQRLVSFSAGMMFGETAMLDGQGRSAAARADTAAVVHALHRSAFETLSAADPLLGQRLATNIALHLADRLRGASAAWRASSG